MRWFFVTVFLFLMMSLSLIVGCTKQQPTSKEVVHLVDRCKKYVPGGDFREFSGICEGPTDCQNFCASWCHFENFTTLVKYDYYKNATDRYLYCDCSCQ